MFILSACWFFGGRAPSRAFLIFLHLLSLSFSEQQINSKSSEKPSKPYPIPDAQILHLLKPSFALRFPIPKIPKIYRSDMKRDHRPPPYQDTCGAGGTACSSGVVGSGSGVAYPSGKAKMWEETEQGAGVDEFLAVLGYKVRSSDMAEVAQKLEQLEEAMGNVQEDGLSHLAFETVHYNPSDLSSWLESMITELNPLPSFESSSTFPLASQPIVDDAFITPAESSIVTTLDNQQQNQYKQPQIFEDSSEYDLTAIPGKAVYPQIQPPQQPPNKRLKPSSASSSSTANSSVPVGIWGLPNDSSRPIESTRPVILVDSQENGIRLVHALMACAEAVQQDNLKVAEVLVKQIRFLAVSQAGAMRKVATYFAEALARRIYRYPQNPQDSTFSDLLQMHFYETCPYLKFAHFTANQAILEAFADKKNVHVIDFSMKQGMQWPALMQALALRPGGPPTFRLTGIGPPSHDDADHLQEVGWKLAHLADTIHVKFEYRGFVANSLADLNASMLDLRDGEAVAVNSVFELHQLLARPGAIEKVLSAVKEMKPDILTVVEQEANHNGAVFVDRFTESLHYYSTLFDSLEGCGGSSSPVANQDKIMSEVYLGKQICNVVAYEGPDRVERHETLSQWRIRFGSAGFEPVHLGSNAFKQASMLLALFNGGDGYRVDENNGCLMLGWHTRPLIATSAWKLG